MDPYRAPPELPTLPGILAQFYVWVMANWRSSLGAIGVIAECAARYGAHNGGPSWLIYGHVVFGVLCVAGFISAGDAKKVADLQAAITQMRALTGFPPLGSEPPGPTGPTASPVVTTVTTSATTLPSAPAVVPDPVVPDLPVPPRA